MDSAKVPFERQRLSNDEPPPHQAGKSRGRPPNHRGVEDFTLEQIDRIYPRLLARYKKVPSDIPASQSAYDRLARRARDPLKNIDWTSLRNKHTNWKHGRFHPIGNCIDSEHHDAKIERLFPARPHECGE